MEQDRAARTVTTSLLVAATASVGAGLVHAAAAGSHSDDAELAWLFALCAVAQIGWAALAVTRPSRRVVAAGVLLNAGCVVVWVLTRTVGLVGPLADVEPVATQDLVAAVLGTAAAAGAGLTLAGRRRDAGDGASSRHRLDVGLVAGAAVLVLLLAVPAMASTHTHGDHEHADTTDVVAAGHADDGATDHVHDAATDHAHGTDASASGPVVALDDPRLTSAQRARATSLLDRTRAAMAAFPDEASVIAAGYTWIGDGRRPGGFQHFVNSDYLDDGRMLDPGHVESFVLQVRADGTKQVLSAMYIAEPGTTMATVPDVGGALTVWHDHQNLCWEGNRLAGILVDGQCRPGGTLRGTKPMIHVWLDDPPCGPFTGIEGHGGENCAHAHTPA